MNNIQFNFLRMVQENIPFTPAYYASALYKSEDEVLSAYNILEQDGYLHGLKLTMQLFLQRVCPLVLYL